MSDPTKQQKEKRLSPADWERAVALYEAGDMTIKALGTMFGISETAMGAGLRKRDAVKGSKAGDVASDLQKQMKEEHERLVKEVADMKNRYVKFNDLVASMTMKRIGEASRNGTPFGILKADLQVLHSASRILKNTRDEHYHLYGLYKEDDLEDAELPELNIGQYTAEEMENIRAAGEDPELLAEMQADVEELEKMLTEKGLK